MYLKSLFSEPNVDALHRVVREYPLGTFIVCADSKPVVNHQPFLVLDDGSEFGVLQAHIPRANPIWQAFDGSLEALVLFHGPNAYVSPSWYPSKREHGKAVPTWNYVVVHAHGTPRAIDDPDWILRHLEALTNEHEAGLPERWRVSDAPEAYLDEMVSHLVGVEIPVTSMVGKWKLGQNRPVADRAGVVEALESTGDDVSAAVARMVRAKMPDLP